MSIEHPTIPLKGMRGMIADHMVKSLATAAQLTHHASVDLSALLKEKARLNNVGCKLSVEDFFLYATVNALKKHPQANGRVDGHSIELSEAINLSIAISLPDNLLVAPAIFGADKIDIIGINKARKDLAKRALSNEVSVPEMTGGTFTVSNLGLTRVEQFTPIINLPQICILGIGCIVERAIRGPADSVDFRPFANLSLTFDHRAINGEPAGQFLSTLCGEIESISDAVQPA